MFIYLFTREKKSYDHINRHHFYSNYPRNLSPFHYQEKKIQFFIRIRNKVTLFVVNMTRYLAKINLQTIIFKISSATFLDF